MDDDLRQAERAWRARPDDQAALTRWIEGRYRTGLAVSHELLERQVHPERELVLPTPCRVVVELPDGTEVWLEPSPTADGRWRVAVPAHSLVWIAPSQRSPEALAALIPALPGRGVRLQLDLAGAADPLTMLRAVRAATCTHLVLTLLPVSCWELLEAVVQLPRLSSLRLVGSGTKEAVRAEGLAPLARAGHLSQVELSRLRLEAGALPALASAGLLELSLDEPEREYDEALEPETVDAELAALARAAPGLRRLDLAHSGRGCGDAGLERLAEGAPGLELLRLPPSEALTDRGVQALGTLPVVDLALGGERLTDAALGELSILRLTRLSLGGGTFTSPGLMRLPPGLQALSVQLPAGPAPLRWIAPQGESLTELSLRLSSDASTPDLERLRDVPLLESLSIHFDAHGTVSSEALCFLSGHHQLRALYLFGLPDLTLAGADTLRRLPLNALLIAEGGDQRRAVDGGVEPALARLAGHRQLERLLLEGCASLTDDTLRAFARAPALKLLRINRCPLVSRSALQELAAASGFAVYLDYERLGPER